MRQADNRTAFNPARPWSTVQQRSTALKFDESEVRKFVSMIGLPFMVLGIDATKPGAQPIAHTYTSVDEVVAFAREKNAAQCNVYWLPNVASIQNKKPSKSDMTCARFVWADCDPDIKQRGTYENARRYLLTEHAKKLTAVASFVIDSGNGLQAFFRLAKPLSLADGCAEYERLNERVGDAYAGPGTFNCDRIMRLPGTLNWPTAAKLNKGYPPEPGISKLLSITDRDYLRIEIEMLLPRSKAPAIRPTETVTASARGSAAQSEQQRFDTLLQTDAKLRVRWEGGIDGLDGDDKSGSVMDLSLYAMLVARSFEHNAIVEIMECWEHGSDGGREQGERYWKRLQENTKATPPTLTPMGKTIAELNKQYALVTVGASAFVLDEACSPVNFLKVDTFRTLLANRYVDVPAANGTKKMPVADAWLKHPERRTFTTVTFAPGGATSGAYNLFRGWSVRPYEDMDVDEAADKCHRFLAHMKDNVCRGDAEQFHYLLNWYAHIFQKPGEKPGVAIAVRGEKGVGKSKVTETIAVLLGPHALAVSQSQHLTGNFNAHHAQALLVTAEEAVWAGDKQAEGALKHMITSPTMALERKGVDVIQVPSCARFVMNSNADWVFPASADERRLFAVDCGSDHRQDTTYFRAIDDQLYGPGNNSHKPGQESPGLRALLTVLLGVDLTAFDVRRAPETDALKAQRAASLAAHEEFLKDCLENHTIAEFDWSDDDEQSVSKLQLHQSYIQYAKGRGQRYPVSQEIFAKTIKRAFRWGTRKPHNKQREWLVSKWSESREAFEEAMQIKLED